MSEIRDTVRLDMAIMLADQEAKYLKNRWDDVAHEYLVKADQILSIKGLAIVDKKAKLPTLRGEERKDSDYNYKYYAFKDIVKEAQQDMLKAGYVKEVQK